HLYLGTDINTGLPFFTPFDTISHTLMQGATGLGKSTFMKMALASVVKNLDLFEHVYLVDLKYGLSALPFAKLDPRITVIARHDAVPPLIDRLEALSDQRGVDLGNRGLENWDGGITLVIVDEFSDLLLELEKTADRTRLENRLIRIASKSRTLGIRLWMQVQSATADAIPANLKRNLTSRIAFRQTNPEATAMFASTEHMPAELPTLREGQVIFQDGRTSRRYALQGALTSLHDVKSAYHEAEPAAELQTDAEHASARQQT
ncbi:MAG: hypothetical protein ABL908_08215, partial [Hyphomicrobium sp.]